MRPRRCTVFVRFCTGHVSEFIVKSDPGVRKRKRVLAIVSQSSSLQCEWSSGRSPVHLRLPESLQPLQYCGLQFPLRTVLEAIYICYISIKHIYKTSICVCVCSVTPWVFAGMFRSANHCPVRLCPCLLAAPLLRPDGHESRKCQWPVSTNNFQAIPTGCVLSLNRHWITRHRTH